MSSRIWAMPAPAKLPNLSQRLLHLCLLCLLGLVACQTSAVPPITPTPLLAALSTLPAPATVPPPAIAPTTAAPTLTPFTIDNSQLTINNSPTPTLTATTTLTPSPTPIGSCTDRIPADDLLTLVTLTYSLSRHYQPADLVPLADYLPHHVTLGYPTELRQVAAGPLVEMIEAMYAAGLSPFIISGYRSYAMQAIAWNKWNRLEPERAHQLSAPPGFSEHQLGTTVDFGSPELAQIVGDPNIEFHTYFYQTSEGQWLLEHAHEYGFTLSYSREAFELTGFYYEPWHYRYIGPELATILHEQGQTLTAYQLNHYPLPCLPD